MKFTVRYTSAWEPNEIEFNTLEEFMNWVKKVNISPDKKNYDGVIIKPPLMRKDGTYDSDEWTLEIYDDWRE